MQPVQHQMMGYDRAITMFSPDGRLLQVEYARKTVRLGSSAIGMVCKDGVLLVTDKRVVDKLVVADEVEKIWVVDEHIIATAAGILADARVLIERAQMRSQQHFMTYNSQVDLITIVKDICNLKQYCTQSGGLRPFGISLLLAGKDQTGLKLFETDPTGSYTPYLATAIGEAETEIQEILSKEYSQSLSVEDGLKLAVKSLKKVLGSDFALSRVDASYITVDGTVKKFSNAELNKIAK
ncbi:MAG: archaeal proteasome endopeptidase complex subunit alpha [Candidatus Woesearchaeota archaeon]|nr:MAG: archaeal proteasome endopeptidase complex subunit alpha [Candidatus Woesearchaeota archaeon]